MIRVKILLLAEGWKNSVEVVNTLYSIPSTEPVIIDTEDEGFSLKSFGVLQVIDRWVADTGRSPDTVKINSPNQYEKINYQFLNRRVLHFFQRDFISKYCVPSQDLVQAEKLFGFFIGRYTSDRNMIAKDILATYKQNFLMSVMNSKYRFGTWWDPEVFAVGSIDNQLVQNQYRSDGINTNYSLLQFYNQFEIELVSETFLYGETFFPTEKTVRPIVGCRPMLINGPVNFLDNLKRLGFKTFDQLWSEDYDRYEMPQRWEQLKLTIDHIINHGYDRNLANDIVQYNYNHLQTMPIQQMRLD
jgi:hypothetical protein